VIQAGQRSTYRAKQPKAFDPRLVLRAPWEQNVLLPRWRRSTVGIPDPARPKTPRGACSRQLTPGMKLSVTVTLVHGGKRRPWPRGRRFVVQSEGLCGSHQMLWLARDGSRWFEPLLTTCQRPGERSPSRLC